MRQCGIVVFDNRSGFPKVFADLLSSLVTGSGDSKRELYTTDTEYAFKVKRPVIVNGIDIPSDRADLLSRFVSIEVPAITSEERISEAEFWASFERDRGKLLVAYFDIISGVLRNRKPVSWRPRMSDWGELASALYDHMGWGRDMFKLDHAQIEVKQHDAALESIVGQAVLSYLMAEFDDGKTQIILPKSDLWLEVKLRVDPESRRWFPQSSIHFGRELSRLKQALKAKGFEVGEGHIGTGNKKRNAVRITVAEEDLGRMGQIGSDDTVLSDPADIAIGKRRVGGNVDSGSDGSDDFSTSSVSNKKIYTRKRRRRKKISDPSDPARKPAGKTPANGRKKGGSDKPESSDPHPTHGSDSDFESYLKELEDEE